MRMRARPEERARPSRRERAARAAAAQGRTHVMGVLNVTPDSFSDGGRITSAAGALAAGRALAAAGAGILDVGGQSTRPGAARVGPEQEAARVVPVIRRAAGAGLGFTSGRACLRHRRERGAQVRERVSRDAAPAHGSPRSQARS
jgi:dihydropteroate synthase